VASTSRSAGPIARGQHALQSLARLFLPLALDVGHRQAVSHHRPGQRQGVGDDVEDVEPGMEGFGKRPPVPYGNLGGLTEIGGYEDIFERDHGSFLRAMWR
jgi:hypothetical protein